MKRMVWLLAAMLLLGALGCSSSNNDNPVDGGEVIFTDSTTYDATTGVYTTLINGSSYSESAYLSFAEAAASATAAAEDWDISFLRTNINLNGGGSADGARTVAGANLGEVVFADVTIDDTAGVEWVEDTAELVISEWFSYNFSTHQFNMTLYVYSMIDAEGDKLYQVSS